MQERMEIIDQLLRLPSQLLIRNTKTPISWNHDYGLWIDVQDCWTRDDKNTTYQLLVNSPFSNEELMSFVEDCEVMRIYDWRRQVQEREVTGEVERPTEWSFNKETA